MSVATRTPGEACSSGAKGSGAVFSSLFGALSDAHLLRASTASKRQPDASDKAAPRAIRRKSHDMRVPSVMVPGAFAAADPSLGVILELVHKSRHLRAKLKRWMQDPVTPPLHVLLVDADRRVLDGVTRTLERVANSNGRFGLLPFPIMISRATSVIEAKAALNRRGGAPIALALINLSDGMATDYLQSDEWAAAPSDATVFVGCGARHATRAPFARPVTTTRGLRARAFVPPSSCIPSVHLTCVCHARLPLFDASESLYPLNT